MSLKLSNRRDFLKSFLVFLSSFSTRLRYEAADIFTLVTSSAKDSGLEFLAFDCNLDNKPFDILWQVKIDGIPKSLSAAESDKALLLDFGKELGKTDAEGQQKHIELYKQSFTTQLEQAQSELSQKSRLYKAMGFFLGTTVALMII